MKIHAQYPLFYWQVSCRYFVQVSCQYLVGIAGMSRYLQVLHGKVPPASIPTYTYNFYRYLRDTYEIPTTYLQDTCKYLQIHQQSTYLFVVFVCRYVQILHVYAAILAGSRYLHVSVFMCRNMFVSCRYFAAVGICLLKHA